MFLAVPRSYFTLMCAMDYLLLSCFSSHSSRKCWHISLAYAINVTEVDLQVMVWQQLFSSSVCDE